MMRATATGLLVQACLIAGMATLHPSGADPADSAASLLKKLQAGEQVRVVAFGDSLTDGMELERPRLDTYHRIFAQALRERFPGPIEVVSVGIPGDTTGRALDRLAGDVLDRKPDLVIVQFGGNDQREGRTPEEYGTDLETIAGAVQERTPAAVILCTPPMGDTEGEDDYVARARRAGERARVAVADLDRAIRAGVHDHRGPFPYGSHPRAFTHAIMAREVYRAFDELLGVRPALQVRLLGGRWLATAGDAFAVRAEVANLSDELRTGTVRLSSGLLNGSRDFALKAKAKQVIEFPMQLPRQGFPRRAESHRVWCAAICGGHAAFDLKWLALSPATSCADGARPQRLGADHRALGYWWSAGPQDLEATFAVRVEEEALVIRVDVTDDDVSPGKLSAPSEGDSVELFLDLRPDEDQGQPVFAPEVALLIVVADAHRIRTPRWRTLDAPLPGIEEADISCTPTESGYGVRVALPKAFIERYRGPDWELFGFDVGINEADGGAPREVQLMWSGIADNYLIPGLLGAVVREEVGPDAICVTLR